MTTSPLFQSLTLPNGAVIPNRLAKAAMEENLADHNQAPATALWKLYEAWAQGGAGLLLTGNVMVDGRAMTGPGGVVLQDDSQLDSFRRWAQVGRARGAQFWMQINHPGRQVMADMGQPALAPSAKALELGNLSKLFAQPRAMTEADIQEVIRRFATTARLAEQAGFTGVQIHAAHGYLLSQFLSPLVNQRADRWGGSLDNRARLLVEIVKAVRATVSPSFCVAVKLNSADFQRGGFDQDDARQVIGWLNELNVDMVELSGGSYEAPAMQGDSRDGRTLAREAYFLEFAEELAKAARMPVMVTGGIRRRVVAEQVLASGVAMVGIGTALALDPALPEAWKRGEDRQPQVPPITWKNKALASLGLMSVIKHQLNRLSRGKSPWPGVPALWATVSGQVKTKLRTRRYRQWVARTHTAG